MNKTPVSAISGLPEALKKYVRNASLFDSSCSDAARVWFSHIGGGFYIKSAPPGSLKEEAEMTAFFHSRKLGAEVLDYLSLERDWLVTRAVPGEDCLHSEYRNDPKRLSETLGRLLRQLHETDPAGCPYSHRNNTRYAHIPADFRQQYPDFLTGQVLLHGDYCLPNVMLHDWEFSGFIDVDSGGIGGAPGFWMPTAVRTWTLGSCVSSMLSKPMNKTKLHRGFCAASLYIPYTTMPSRADRAIRPMG